MRAAAARNNAPLGLQTPLHTATAAAAAAAAVAAAAAAAAAAETKSDAVCRSTRMQC